jgi:hypothetical protein
MRLLKNSEDEYPWQTLRWSYAFGFFILPTTIAGIQEGIPFVGFSLGTGFCVFLALLAWKWPI